MSISVTKFKSEKAQKRGAELATPESFAACLATGALLCGPACAGTAGLATAVVFAGFAGAAYTSLPADLSGEE